MSDAADNKQTQEVSYLDMSDEELMKLSPPPITAAVEEKDPEDPALVTNDDPTLVDDNNDEGKGKGTADEEDDADAKAAALAAAATGSDLGKPDDAAGGNGGKPKQEGKGDGEDDAAAGAAGKAKSAESGADDSKNKDDKAKGDEDAPPAIDYEAEYKRLTAPFKANGRDIAVKSVDDAIALMQMGANYNKKMAALKPNLKLMKQLENNGLLSEEKIGFLIDLSKGNAGALNKLISDSKIDPMELSAEKAGEYKQTTYAVSDTEIILDRVLEEISDSKAYTQTLEVVSKKWDNPSKKAVADNPELLKVINTHIEAGMYDLIAAEIESERTFGRLAGLSDIEAYRQVGDALYAKGAFNHLGQGSSPAQKETAPKTVVVPPKPSKDDEDKLKEKRRAASPSRPAAPAAAKSDFDPLAMSDEEFAKQVHSKFL